MIGIDVSQFNGTLNWDTLKSSGVAFAIIRAGYGGGGHDAAFTRNWSEAKRVGIQRFAYHFAYPGRSSGAQQARDFLGIVGGFQPTDGIMLDMEDEPVYGRGLVASDVGWSKEFLDTSQQVVGFKGIIYMDSDVKGRFDWTPVKNADYGLNCANYGANNGQGGTPPNPAPWDFWAMWQYTSVGNVGGATPLDLDEFNGNADMLKKYGAPGVVTPAPAPAPAPVPAPAAPTASGTYTVASGDNLSAIAGKFGTSWQALASLNHLANPNLIYPGQVLRVPGGPTDVPSQTYTVVSGDNLSTIAAKFGTSWQRLAQLNGLANANLIFPGQVLKVN
jgi:lysozyme